MLPAKCLKRNSRQMEKNHEPYQNLYLKNFTTPKSSRPVYNVTGSHVMVKDKNPFFMSSLKVPKVFELESTVTVPDQPHDDH